MSFAVSRDDGADMYYCDCKKFEHCGMPCRHILCVSLFILDALFS
jgi:hypothetical protein